MGVAKKVVAVGFLLLICGIVIVNRRHGNTSLGSEEQVPRSNRLDVSLDSSGFCPHGHLTMNFGYVRNNETGQYFPTTFLSKHYCRDCRNEEQALEFSRNRTNTPGYPERGPFRGLNTVILGHSRTHHHLTWRKDATTGSNCFHREFLHVMNCNVREGQENCVLEGVCKTYHDKETGHLQPFHICRVQKDGQLRDEVRHEYIWPRTQPLMEKQNLKNNI